MYIRFIPPEILEPSIPATAAPVKRITDRVLFVIILVILLGRVKRGCGNDFGGNGVSVLADSSGGKRRRRDRSHRSRNRQPRHGALRQATDSL